MFPSFLANGGEALVRTVIVRYGQVTEYHIVDADISSALVLAFKNDKHDNIMNLLDSVRTRHAEKDRLVWQKGTVTNFEAFLTNFFVKLAPEKNDIHLKRFLTLGGKEFNRKHPATYRTFCQKLVSYLRFELDNPNARNLLTEFIGQYLPLSATAFANGFLRQQSDDTERANFLECSYREAIEVALIEDHPGGGEALRKVMNKKYPEMSLPACPIPTEILTVALVKFPTKQECENEWTKKNIPTIQARFQARFKRSDLRLFPKVLVDVVLEYAITITWLDTLNVQ